MTILERNIHEDLGSADDIRWIRGYLQGLLASGQLTPDELEQVLKRVHEKYRNEGREDLADLTLDGLDFLTGWCGPNMGIAERESA